VDIFNGIFIAQVFEESEQNFIDAREVERDLIENIVSNMKNALVF